MAIEMAGVRKSGGKADSTAKVLGVERPVDAAHEGQKHPFRRPRDAATLIIVRQGRRAPEILLGCRDAGHAFMPNRYVFPGGRVDLADSYVPHATPLRADVEHRLLRAATPNRARALAVAAIRETFEETGLIIGKKIKAPVGGAVSEPWRGFIDAGFAPALDALDYIARAITPPGRPRRFNARFFMADESAITGGVIKSNGELGDIRWVPLDEAQQLPVPTITTLVLGEVARLLKEPPTRRRDRRIPLFKTVHGKHLLLQE
jgi:8-oxo-dGTP pyrophosphatase MutT (NUDIX family)